MNREHRQLLWYPQGGYERASAPSCLTSKFSGAGSWRPLERFVRRS